MTGRRPRGTERRSGRGRPSGARSGRWRRVSVGVDLGGTKIALGVVDRSGRLLETARLPTRASRPASAVIRDIVDQVETAWAPRLERTTPLGIGVAGQVDRDGRVLFGPNLGWHQVPLGSRLAKALGRPVAVLNDVQAATYGEWRHGAGRGDQEMVCIFVGTGVGGGIVSGGRLQQGASGSAGELGHLTVERDGRPCRCPNRGCLEAYAGGWAIAQRAQEAVTADPRRGEALLTLAGKASAISSETVEVAYRRGDPLAKELVEATVAHLCDGLVSVVNALNPSTIVLGGGVIAGYPRIVPRLEREVRGRALAAATRQLHIVPAALGGESGVVGAAAYAREFARS